MPFNDPCIQDNVGRRRSFWTTQPRACGDYTLCGTLCSMPGLEYENSAEGRSIKTTEWINSLILNILNTRARNDLSCPAPSAVYGHWSESYRNDQLYIGSTLWNAAEKKYVRVVDAVKAIEAAVKADVSKLVAMGVASDVAVVAEYRGRNTVAVLVTATVSQVHHVLNLSGAFVSGAWVWQ